jgi:hypothetical protein
MSYKPADHVIEPRQIVAAWAVCAALLVMGLGASINHSNADNSSVRETLLAQPGEGGAVGAVTKSSWRPGEHGHTGTGCADNIYG